jgi:hypothetical protein
VLQNFVEVQRSVCACIGPGDSPAQLLYVFGDFNISDNSENDDEYFPNVRHNVGSLVFVSVCFVMEGDIPGTSFDGGRAAPPGGPSVVFQWSSRGHQKGARGPTGHQEPN